MNYPTVEEAKSALLGKVVKMRVGEEPYVDQVIGIVESVIPYSEFSGSEFSRNDSRPVAAIRDGGSWFACQGDWEIAIG